MGSMTMALTSSIQKKCNWNGTYKVYTMLLPF